MKSYIFGRLWAFFTHWFSPVFNQVTYLFYHWCKYASLIRSCIVPMKHHSSMTGLPLPCLGQGEKTRTWWPICFLISRWCALRTGAVVLVTAERDLFHPASRGLLLSCYPEIFYSNWLVSWWLYLQASLLVFMCHIRIEGSVDSLSRTSWFKVCRGSCPSLSNFQRRCFTWPSLEAILYPR